MGYPGADIIGSVCVYVHECMHVCYLELALQVEVCVCLSMSVQGGQKGSLDSRDLELEVVVHQLLGAGN